METPKKTTLNLKNLKVHGLQTSCIGGWTCDCAGRKLKASPFGTYVVLAGDFPPPPPLPPGCGPVVLVVLSMWFSWYI